MNQYSLVAMWSWNEKKDICDSLKSDLKSDMAGICHSAGTVIFLRAHPIQVLQKRHLHIGILHDTPLIRMSYSELYFILLNYIILSKRLFSMSVQWNNALFEPFACLSSRFTEKSGIHNFFNTMVADSNCICSTWLLAMGHVVWFVIKSWQTTPARNKII